MSDGAEMAAGVTEIGQSAARRRVVASRGVLLLPACLCAAVVAITLSLRGHGWLNLDSLLESPAPVYALVVLPSALALVLLAGAILPRILLINLAVFAALLAAVEAGAWLFMPAPLPLRGEPEAIGGETFYVPHSGLGYALAPSMLARHRRTAGGQTVYDVTYEIDDRGRRATPAEGAQHRRSFLLFFGDSNTFGEGLGQADTLPYYAGLLADGYRPYNYGVPGYGPQHLLELTRVRRFAEDVPEAEGSAVFFFIPAHVPRVVGSSRVSTGWGRHFAFYHLDADGRAVSAGDFVHARPLQTLGYYFWNASPLAEALDVELPGVYTASDYRLTARVLAEGGRALGRQVRLRGFYVMLGQAYNASQRRVLDSMREALAREGVATLDYAGLLDLEDPRYRISDFDWHDSGTANRALAARLVSDLGIGR